MGRYVAKRIIIRELPELTIVFSGHHTIHVFPRHGTAYLFHRWFCPRGSYRDCWEPFRRKLLRYRHLDMATCRRLAAQHDILVSSTGTPLDLSTKDVEIRYPKWRVIGRMEKL